MGKLKTFEIKFEKYLAVHNAGEVLKGDVTIDVVKDYKLRAVRILLHGSSYVRWTERQSSGKGKKRRTINKVHCAAETYFNYTQILLGSGSGAETESDAITLPSGHYVLPFEYKLPTTLPSSFESGTHGHVRYWAKAYIDRPWRFDKTTKRLFTVCSTLDLNTIPDALASQYGEAQKTLCCWCCESGPLSIVFQLKKAGYVPGEYIIPDGEIINNTRKLCPSSKLEIVQRILFRSTENKLKKTVRVVADLDQGPIPPGDSCLWKGSKLQIPSVPPSGLLGCQIIDIDYRVKMVVVPPGPSIQLEIPLNLIIGTLPIHGAFSDGSSKTDFSTNTTYDTLSDFSNAEKTDTPSVIYLESVGGKICIRGDEETGDIPEENSMFAPYYANYNISQEDDTRL